MRRLVVQGPHLNAIKELRKFAERARDKSGPGKATKNQSKIGPGIKTRTIKPLALVL